MSFFVSPNKSFAAVSQSQPQMSDTQLLACLKQGEQSALAQLFVKHRDAVHRFALAFTASTSVADDVTQETFMQLLLKPDGFDEARGSLAGYLCGIARNCARAALRETPAERNVEWEEDDSSVQTALYAPREMTALDALAKSEEEHQLWRAIRKLPAHYREVLILVELQDFSYAQAAQLLAIELGTVRSRLSRAKERLATLLAPTVGSSGGK
jgi:RNA polymerase sigma-70 factor, ECF subfamily